MAPEKKNAGRIARVSGPVVVARNLEASMGDLVAVGEERLMGEVIRIQEESVVIQVYEETSGLRPGSPVENTGQPLSVELGPGLLSQIYDGIQRPLYRLKERMGSFIQRGIMIPGLDHARTWDFHPLVKEGEKVEAGFPVGYVEETPSFRHLILAPPDSPPGRVHEIREGSFTVDEEVCRVLPEREDSGGFWKVRELPPFPVTLGHRWPVRRPRPARKKLPPQIPLITGQRIFDTFFPLAKGGTAAIPGPFGSGKTVSQQQLARYSDAHIVVFVGCGERGNEMTEVLTEFPGLRDPRTGRPLMERTILVANTSNMPVAAREASVYTGITLAEYYRDMGLDVALMADSTSRWAEAMREISSRMGEMPGEEGYPAYLASRLAAFYERAGRVETLGGATGSVSIIGAVSPPGGDFNEPVTQGTLRIVKVFWALDAQLAQRRHFPAFNWLSSYSLYQEELSPWLRREVGEDFGTLRSLAMKALQREAELQEIVQLVGADTLPEEERLVLEVGRLLREVVLQQNAYHEVDSFCPLSRQYVLLKGVMDFYCWGEGALKEGRDWKEVMGNPALQDLVQLKYEVDFDERARGILKRLSGVHGGERSGENAQDL